MITLLGIPFDANSSFRRGPAAGPNVIRDALYSESSNMFAENGQDLGAANLLHDAGDLDVKNETGRMLLVNETAAQLFVQDKKLLSLGGDHSVTFPLVEACASKYHNLTLVHFDAHPDLYDEYDGNRFSNACPFARIMEKGLVKRLVQIGIRTMNAHQREQAERFGVEVLDMKRTSLGGPAGIEGPVYISLDIDVLDPAYAPGVSHPEAGGLSTRQLLNLIGGIEAPVVGADIVEFNPENDIGGITAAAAAKLVKEIAAKMLQS